MTKKKVLDVLTVIHYGKYGDDDSVIDDNCPCCNWEPPQGEAPQPEGRDKDGNGPYWHLGMIWHPASERSIGAYFQVFHCQNCGLVYATHVN